MATKPSRSRVLSRAWQVMRDSCPDLDSPEAPPERFAEMLSQTAHHEAAHYVARVFFRGPQDTVEFVDILGTEELAGRIRESGVLYRILRLTPYPEFRWRNGLNLMICDIAGGMAGAKCSGETLDYDEWMDSDENCEAESYEPGTIPIWNGMADELKVWFVADVLATRGWSRERVVRRAFDLTAELLEVPDVWDCVCRLADMLLEHGKLGTEEMIPVCRSVECMVARIPRWRRRFHVDLMRYIQQTETPQTGAIAADGIAAGNGDTCSKTCGSDPGR